MIIHNIIKKIKENVPGIVITNTFHHSGNCKIEEKKFIKFNNSERRNNHQRNLSFFNDYFGKIYFLNLINCRK